MYSLKYNLFENEIKILEQVFEMAKNGYDDIEPLLDEKNAGIIQNQINLMKENRNNSKKIILSVLNDTNNEYNDIIKMFYNNEVLNVINKNNEFLNNGQKVKHINYNFNHTNDDIWENDKLLEEKVRIYLKDNNISLNNEDYEIFIKEIKSASKKHKPAGFEWICNNTIKVLEVKRAVLNKENKVYSQKDFEKLSEFANKLGKDELNELQNILIQCEYDNKVLSDFTSAVNKIVINKNVEENYMLVNTMMVYDTKNSWFFDISMTDKNGNKKLSFEKFVNLLNDYKNDNLIVVQTKLPTFKEFEPYEDAIIKGMFAVAKDNGNKLMDFVTVNVDAIKKDGDGQYNFKSIIDKDCYSYKFKTKQNVKIHFNKLEINEELKQRQGFYANEIQAQKIEEAIPKLK